MMSRASFAFGVAPLIAALMTGCIQNERAPIEDATSEPVVAAQSRSGAPLLRECEGGEVARQRASACIALSGYYERGAFGLPWDPGRAVELWERGVDILMGSCDRGNVADCTGAATAMGMAIRPGSRPEPGLWMVEYAKDGCRGGDAPGCALLGVIYEQGRGVEKDGERSNAYYEQACEIGHRNSCLLLASRSEGIQVVTNYERACSAESGFGCAAAAHRYWKGIGAPRDIERAGELFKRGCAIGAPIACVMGAEMYDALGEPRRAMEVSWAGCKQGIAGACTLFGDLCARSGEPEHAKRAYERACELADEGACRAVRAIEERERKRSWSVGDGEGEGDGEGPVF